MPKTALVTGGTGLLGRQVVEAFKRAGWSVVATGFSRANPPSTIRLDLTNDAEVESALNDIKPHVVVHCAAHRLPDVVDKDPDAARRLNITATNSLTRMTSTRNCFLLYLSTDYIFPGRPGDAPYASSANPEPTNLYGQTKLDGEQAVLELTRASGLGAVLRVPVLYGEVKADIGNKESAVNVLIDAVDKAQNEKVVMDDWSIRYPTNTEDVGRVCVAVCNKFLELGGLDEWKRHEKRLQFTSEERFTKYEMCQLFAEILNTGIGNMVANKEGNDPNASVQRPYDCHLSTQALQEMGVDIKTQDFKSWWRRQLNA